VKILLDENLPIGLKTVFPLGFEVKTVREMKWNGKKNGELLGLMTFNGFEVFITIDKNLKNQQNLNKFNISVFLLMAINNRRETLESLISKAITKIESGDYDKLTIIF
jgi:predicted nuclease of predicted toxin-antitoxin system